MWYVINQRLFSFHQHKILLTLIWTHRKQHAKYMQAHFTRFTMSKNAKLIWKKPHTRTDVGELIYSLIRLRFISVNSKLYLHPSVTFINLGTENLFFSALLWWWSWQHLSSMTQTVKCRRHLFVQLNSN